LKARHWGYGENGGCEGEKSWKEYKAKNAGGGPKIEDLGGESRTFPDVKGEGPKLFVVAQKGKNWFTRGQKGRGSDCLND